MSAPRFRSILIASVHALLIGVAGCRAGEGQNRLSETSSSASAARRSGVFISDVEVTRQDDDQIADTVRLKEAWMEEVVERFEVIPLRRKAIGTRLCVRLIDAPQTPVLWNVNARLQVDGSTKLRAVRDATVYSGGNVVFSFKAGLEHAFPKKGTIVITDFRNDRHIVSIAFSKDGDKTGGKEINQGSNE